MARSKPEGQSRGGRPRNAWNPSRRRKLVRLYTLTRLGQDEIQKVLTTKSFSPSTRDMQNQLRSLFNEDYAKEHRKYRPQNGRSMDLRFHHLHHCRNARITKRHNDFGPNRMTFEVGKKAANQNIDSSGELATAFRSYSVSLPKSSVYQFNLSNSALNTPSLLMLDGSSLERSGDQEVASATRDISGGIRAPNSNANHENASVGYSEDIFAEVREKRIPNDCGITSRTTSLQSLRKRLADRYSDGYLGHIQSVLRCSSSNSWRSTLTSFSSIISWRTRSSASDTDASRIADSDPMVMKSEASSPTKHQYTSVPRTEQDTSGTNAGSFQIKLQIWKPWTSTPLKVPKIPLESDLGRCPRNFDRNLWNWRYCQVRKMLDERKVVFRSTLRRTCCLPFANLGDLQECEKCGLSVGHQSHILRAFGGWSHGQFELKRLPMSVGDITLQGKLDFYGNSQLHALAEAIDADDLRIIKSVIESGISQFSLQQRNTSGTPLCMSSAAAVCETIDIQEHILRF